MSAFSQKDILYMRRALQLAELGGVEAAPNPMVGSVIVHNDAIIGEGYHQRYGEAHAEVNAVSSVANKELLSKSTIYVTLEPCAHHGKTPPCSDLIIEKEFSRVVVACQDSFAKVSGKGIEKMRNVGIQVDVGLLEEEARKLNARFFTYHEKKRPYVILKWAQTKDGFIDRLPEERDKGVNWITSPLVKPLVHRWRSEEQAIMVGWKTVKNDDPSLTVREVKGASPHRFIIDPYCKTPVEAKVIKDGLPTTLISRANNFVDLPDQVEVVEVNDFSSENILKVLYDKNILSVFVEGGACTLQHFIDNDLWDEGRVLTGDVKFEKGLIPPQIKSPKITSTNKLDKDLITYIENK